MSTVADFGCWRDGLGCWNRNWRRNLFQWEDDQLRDLQLIIQAGLKGEGCDSWFWKKDSTGCYSVRSAYKWLCLSDTIQAVLRCFITGCGEGWLH